MNSGEYIKKIRQEKGLSQKELGEKLGVSQQMIGQWETGKANPKIETIQKIADALEVELWEIVELDQMDENTRMREMKNMLSRLSYEGLEVVNRYLRESLYSEKSLPEESLLDNYRQLNFDGQQKVINYVEDLIKIPEYQKEPPRSEPLNAAHAIQDASKEDIQHDEDIMDDEDF